MAFDESVAGVSSVIGVLLPLVIVAVVLRFNARRLQKAYLGVDDWCMLPALLCFIAISGIGIYGMVNHFIAFPMSVDQSFLDTEIPIWVRAYWAADLLSIIALGSIRTSALFFYRRVFVVRQKRGGFNVVTAAAIVIVALWTLGMTLLQIFVCGSHFDKIFSLNIEKDCVVTPYLEALATSSFLLDICVLILPIPMIWRLHIRPSRKLGICAVFALAVAGTAASCTRMVITYPNLATETENDQFITNTELFYFLTLEVGLCFIAANLPSLWYYVSSKYIPENVVRSVRSLISLASFHSKNNETRKQSLHETESSASRIEATTEIEVTHELGNDRGQQPLTDVHHMQEL